MGPVGTLAGSVISLVSQEKQGAPHLGVRRSPKVSENPGLSPSPLSTEGALINHTVSILRFGVLALGGPVMAELGADKKRVTGELKDTSGKWGGCCPTSWEPL